MKNTLILMAACLFSMGAMAKGGHSGGSHAVSSHTTKSGTYVAPTRATNSNATRTDNYSHKGNVNPANGKVGTKD